MKTINAQDKKLNRHNMEMIVKCAERYEAFCESENFPKPERIDLIMTLDFADKDCGIDFDKLLSAPDFDFIHDVAGLLRHMDRRTCKIGGCFLPRCAI